MSSYPFIRVHIERDGAWTSQLVPAYDVIYRSIGIPDALADRPHHRAPAPGYPEEAAAATWETLAGKPETFPPEDHDASKVTTGVFPIARLATGTPTGSKFLRDDGTLATAGGGGAHATTHESGGADALTLGSIAGTITAGQHGTPAGDLHPGYALDADLAAHESAADPHGVYQKESEKGVASGYASLDAATKVPIAEIPTGTTGSTVCVGNDARLSDARTPTTHASSHQTGGSDEISVAGLSGVLADPQPPIIGAGATQAVAGNDARLTDARTPVAHQHNASDINAGTVGTARLGSGTPDSTKFLRGDQTWAAPSGGSDPWTVLKLTSDFPTTSATAVDVTGLGFTPQANTNYMIEAVLFLRTATATVNPRSGFAWPTGMTDGVMSIDTAQTATTQLTTRGNIAAALLVAVGGLPNTTQSWPAFLYGACTAGATPSGNLRVQLASETAGTTVTMKAGSYLRYRTY